MPAPQLCQCVRQLPEHLSAAGIYDDGGTVPSCRRRGIGKIGKAAQQGGRDIVNAVKADILQRVDHTGFSGAGLTGHDKQLHGASLPLFRQRFYNMIIQGTDRTFNTLSGGFCAGVMIIACAMSHTSPNR